MTRRTFEVAADVDVRNPPPYVGGYNAGCHSQWWVQPRAGMVIDLPLRVTSTGLSLKF